MLHQWMSRTSRRKMWLHLKQLCATWLSLSSFAKKNGEKLVSRFGKFCAGCCGAKLSHSEHLSGKIKSRRAPSEANRPQGQQGHGKNYSGCIWTCSCPPASLSLWSSCVSCNNTEVSASVSSQLHQICIFMWLFAPPGRWLLGSCSKAANTPTLKCSVFV